jgi:16S rRNA (cytosine967-C5)-methyltransferase
MTPRSARELALAALHEWRRGERFADTILARLLASSDLGGADRAFVTELFYGILRNVTLIDFWIDQLRSGRLDQNARDLLRLGIYQLFFLETPAHAALFETVELAGPGIRSLINGILRNAVRRKDSLREEATRQALSVQSSHPEFLLERWTRNFGADQTAALCEWNNGPAPIYARINRLKISDEEFLAKVGSVRCADRTRQRGVPTKENFVRLTSIPIDALAQGHCYIQDPSTAPACELLAPQPGENVLDACAAPGGKTAYLAELMKNRGSIVASDRDAQRIRTLEENLQRLGVEIVRSIQHDWSASEPPAGLAATASFDRILVDAPCSNTGVMRRRVDLRWRLTSKDFSRMAGEQLRILRAVIPLLKPGGTLVYSTCSIEPEENEKTVRAALSEFPFLDLATEVSLLPFRDGFDGAYAAKLTRVR